MTTTRVRSRLISEMEVRYRERMGDRPATHRCGYCPEWETHGTENECHQAFLEHCRDLEHKRNRRKARR